MAGYFAGWAILLAYGIYMVIQFQTYSWWVVKWHTHLAFPVFLFWSGAGLLWLYQTLSGREVLALLKKWFYLSWLLLVLEIIFMLTGLGVWLGDAPFGRYVSTDHVPVTGNYYQNWSPNIEFTIDKGEFIHKRKTNSLGFADYEWALPGQSNATRILCLGDSFTEGEGASFDNSYPQILKGLIEKNYASSFEILNAGSCGSDPFSNYKNYLDRLYVFQPDIIVQTLSSHDILTDILLKGGLERFDSEKGALKRPFGSWQILFTSSYCYRILYLFFHRLTLELRYNVLNRPYIGIDKQLVLLFEEYQNFAKDNGATLILFILPDQYELNRGAYWHPMGNIVKSISKVGIPVVELKDCYKSKAGRNTNITDYYWPKDGHHNAKGYQMMAECIYEGLKENGLIEE